MKTVNGFQLQLLLKEAHAEREMLVTRFPQSLWYFDGETPGQPILEMAALMNIEIRIVQLQCAQAVYNLRVDVEAGASGKMTLMEAVKGLGGVQRSSKLWKKTIMPDKGGLRYRLSQDETVPAARDKDKAYPLRALPVQQCKEAAMTADRHASELKAAIQRGNATEMAAKDLDLPESILG